MHALIADDDRMTAVILKHTLERWGLTVTVAHDGAEAWNVLQQTPEIGLAILDWMMPEVDGPELCRRIREDPARAHIYVLLLTGRQGQADIVAGLSAGADDYLTKPFDPDELRARIHVGQRTLGLIANIKRLTGLLPICSYCKRIRSDHDYWEQVESYITEHTDAVFSHGICPPCLAKVLDGLDPTEPLVPKGDD
jgi:sigma-B regulation protein RsbU (phosphoserine phosphatase)